VEIVQFATAFAREVARRGMRPRLAAGTEPKLRHVPFGQPPKGTLLEFVKD
jgi:cytochrome P450 monooxygenase